MKLFRVALLACFLIPASTEAQSLTGNELLDWCEQAREEEIAKAFCIGYAMGIRGVLPIGCIPQPVTNNQIVDILVKWLRENPEDRDGPAGILSIRALRETYECLNQAWLDFILLHAKTIDDPTYTAEPLPRNQP